MPREHILYFRCCHKVLHCAFTKGRNVNRYSLFLNLRCL